MQLPGLGPATACIRRSLVLSVRATRLGLDGVYTWISVRHHQSFNDRQSVNSSRPQYPMLWFIATVLAWPGLA